MNRDFIAVKIDRQLQPKPGHRYQIVVALVNQEQSGWPASVFVLPARPTVFHPTVSTGISFYRIKA